MKTILFQGVRIVDIHSPFHGKVVDLRLEDGVIADIAEKIDPSGISPEDIKKGNSLSPGWIDMRTHLTDPGFEYKESLESLGRAGQRGGFTALLTLPNSEPPMDNHGQVKALLSRSHSLPVRILPSGTLSKGGKGKDLSDMFDMSQAGAVAFGDGIHSIPSSGLLLRGLQYLKAFEGLLIDSPIIEDLVPGAQVGEGLSSTRIGMKGIPALAETLAVDRNLQILEYFPGRLHLGPLTTKASLDRIRQVKSRFPGLSIETSVYYLAGNDTAIESFDVNAKIWPPLRAEGDRLALIAGISDGTIDVVSSNHHPQSVEEKKHDFMRADFGAAMLEVAFGVAASAVQKANPDAKIIDQLVAALSTGPAHILQLPGYSISKGNRSDLTWFDPKAEYTLEARDFHSKGKNQAFAGVSLKGRALGTVCKGTYADCR